MPERSVSIVGLGKIGTCMAACMANKGMRVIGVDVDPGAVSRLNQGSVSRVEPGLEPLIRNNRSRIRATSDCGQAVRDSEMTFVIVPTPSRQDGAFSLDHVLRAMREIGSALRKENRYHLVTLTSTVLPGATGGEIVAALEDASGKRCGRDIGVCYNPEFIALGSVIHDLMNPDFVLIGEHDAAAGERLERWYDDFCDHRPPVKRMSLASAELTKLALNTFVTTKITFANMLTEICERLPTADIDDVTSALGLDSRIGHRYLKGALGYGGPCFPRDNRALMHLASTVGCAADVANATDRFNTDSTTRRAAMIHASLPPGRVIGVVGTAYKPDTVVVEQSQGLLLARHLAESGRPVVVYDPDALDATRQALGDLVRYASTLRECIDQSDAILIASPCREFKDLGEASFPRRADRFVVFDPWRLLRDRLKDSEKVDYRPLGIGEEPAPRLP